MRRQSDQVARLLQHHVGARSRARRAHGGRRRGRAVLVIAHKSSRGGRATATHVGDGGSTNLQNILELSVGDLQLRFRKFAFAFVR